MSHYLEEKFSFIRYIHFQIWIRNKSYCVVTEIWDFSVRATTAVTANVENVVD